METIELSKVLDSPDYIQAHYNKVYIQIRVTIPFTSQLALIKSYLDDYFGVEENKFIERDPYNFMEAEANLIARIIKLQTNLEFDNTLGIDQLFDSDLAAFIVSKIDNYTDFLERRDYIVKSIREQRAMQNSMSTTFEYLVDEIVKALATIEEYDLSEVKALLEKNFDVLKLAKEEKLTDVGKTKNDSI